MKYTRNWGASRAKAYSRFVGHPLLRSDPGPKVKQRTHCCLVPNRISQIHSQTFCLEAWPRDLSPHASSEARCR